MSIKSSNNRKTGNFSIGPISQEEIQIQERGTVGFSFGGQLAKQAEDKKQMRQSIQDFQRELSNSYERQDL